MMETPQIGFEETSEVLSLIELIYDTVTDGSCWPIVLDRIAEAVNCEEITILPSFSNPGVPNLSSRVRMLPKELALCRDNFQSAEILSEPCKAPFPTGSIRYSYRVAPEAHFGVSAMCSDCGLPHGICCRFGLRMPLSHQPVAHLTCVRRSQSGHFGDADGLAFKTLMPHLQRAFRLYLNCEQAKSNALELKLVLDTFDRAVFGLNRNGMVVLSNRNADAIVEKADGLKLDRGRLVAKQSPDDCELQSHIARFVALSNREGTAQSVSIHLSRDFESLPLQLTITRFQSAMPNNGQLAALVFVSDPSQKPQSCSTLLRQLYGLSPTECRLADLLHQGLEVREAAGRLKTTLETTRFHLKRVLAKTGTRRQTELMRLMLSLPGVTSDTTWLA
jgi:DNA-binding CsgD family transcriptional regulator